jgi:cyclic-di-GMP phosphodiesterase TipF (flagellum assembly factor)
MGETVSGRRLSASGVGWFVLGALLAGGLGAVALTVTADSAAPVVLLHLLSLTGAAAAWFQALRARRAAQKASAGLDAVGDRIAQFELRWARQRTGVDPAPHSTVVEVTGEIGQLGRAARDLAEPVAAHDRGAAGPPERLVPATQSPRPVTPRRHDLAPPPAAVADARHPEPSLLPSARRESAGGPDSATPAARARARPAAAVPWAMAEPRRSLGRLGRPAALSDAEAQRMAAIVEGFEADRIELDLQPVVSLPQRAVLFYDASARLRLADETLLRSTEFLPLLERLGHAAEFDRRVLNRTITVARFLMARGSDAVVAVNLSPRALEEAGFLRSLGRILEAAPDTVGRIVFELSQRCWCTLDPDRAAALAAVRDRGVPFALDRATDLRLDPLALSERGVRFVKIPVDLLLAPDQGADLDIEVSELAAVLLRAGIKLVAEGVEREETVPGLLARNVPLAQGLLFAAPPAVRSEVLGRPQAGKTEERNAVEASPGIGPQAPAGAGGLLPHRTVLRHRS